MHGWARRVAHWWSDQGPTGHIERLMATIQFTPQVNVTGQPAISLPLYWNAQGLPIGIQLVAPLGGEGLLLQIAAQIEEARPWQDRRPLIHG